MSMKFMLMHRVTRELERDGPPTPEELQAIGQLMGDAAQAGVFLGGEGLKPTSQRVHIVYQAGKRTLRQGPFGEVKELPAGYALLRVTSRDEALAWLDRLAAAVGDVEVFLGPVVETWDMGMGEKPGGAPLRFLATYNANASSGELSTDPAVASRLRAVLQEMTAAGVLQDSAELTPTRDGARILYAKAKYSVIDGPFAESKELIADFALFDVASKAAALDWAIRFGDLGGIVEIDVRRVR
jgi:hypothetical protein